MVWLFQSVKQNAELRTKLNKINEIANLSTVPTSPIEVRSVSTVPISPIEASCVSTVPISTIEVSCVSTVPISLKVDHVNLSCLGIICVNQANVPHGKICVHRAKFQGEHGKHGI